MAQYTRLQVLQAIHETGFVPLFHEADAERAKQILAACHRAGVRLVEFTNRGDFAHEVFGELVKYAVRELPGMILGVGTVIDGGTAALYMQLGANFVVTPVFREDVTLTCNRRKVPCLPGCATLTEIARAEELGVEIVKVFPGEMLSPAFIKGVKGPMPWTSMMVTGGVEPTEESLKAWFAGGVTAVGIGSKLIYKGVDLQELESRARFCVDTIRHLKQA